MHAMTRPHLFRIAGRWRITFGYWGSWEGWAHNLSAMEYSRRYSRTTWTGPL